MTELDRALVRRKLAAISRNLQDLELIASLSLPEYLSDRLRRKATERLLQEVVEAAVDVNLHVLRTLNVQVPGDYYTSFIEIGRRAVIAPELAEQLAPAAGLRNRLVHEYDDIDDAIVLQSAKLACEAFGAFVTEIDAYLRRE